MMEFEFDFENSWKEYKEIALLPAANLVLDSDVYRYYSLIFHFLNIKLAFTIVDRKKFI